MRYILAFIVFVAAAGQQGGSSPVATMLASCNTGPCQITIPAGTYTFSQPIAPISQITITGAGAAYENLTGYMPCTTKLIYTGTGIPVQFYGAKASGSTLAGICLDMTNPADAFIDIDQAADDTTIQDVVIDFPQAQANIAAMRWAYTSAIAAARCNHVFVRTAAPVAYMIGNVEAGWSGNVCRGLQNGTNEFQIGSGEYPPEAVQCIMCTAEAKNGETPIKVQNVVGFWWISSYFECGGPYCVDIPSTATLAKAVGIRDTFVGYAPTNSFVHSALSTATVFISGNVIAPATLRAPPTGYVLQDDAVQAAVVTGNTITLPVFSKHVVGLYAFGNVGY
jgi:Pectate lyase superfamily protein